MPLNNHSKANRKALNSLPLPEHAKSNEDSGERLETMIWLRKGWEFVLSTKELNLSIMSSTGFFTIGANPLLLLLGANTLGETAQQIEESTSVDLINWEKEMCLPDLRSSEFIDRQLLKTTGKVVLVTDAGGFLGKHILAQLVASPDIDKIDPSSTALFYETCKDAARAGRLVAKEHRA